MKRPDAVTIISAYHFLIAIPFLIGACLISVFALAPVLAYVGERTALVLSLFGIGLGLFFTLVGSLAFLVVTNCLPEGEEKPFAHEGRETVRHWLGPAATAELGTLGCHRAGDPGAPRLPHLDHHRGSDHLVHAPG